MYSDIRTSTNKATPNSPLLFHQVEKWSLPISDWLLLKAVCLRDTAVLLNRFSHCLTDKYKMSATKVEAQSENPLGPCPGVMFGDPKTTTSAIIVIQEWWGMNQHIQDVAKLIAEKTKFVTLVPDLYRGKVAIDRETAGHYVQDLNWTGAVQDVDAFARYLKSLGIKKVGATGFCLGGAITVAVVTEFDSVDAAAPFYGIPRANQVTYDYSKIKVPIQLHFGEKDEAKGFSSREDYEPFYAKLKEYGVPAELFTYDAGHAFANTTSPNFNKEAYELSFSRIFAFFEKHLK